MLVGQTPDWLQLGGEARARLESPQGIGFRPGHDDTYLLTRLRFSLGLRPAPWFKVFGQAQDARVWGADRIAKAPPFQDRLDLRQAYVELGDAERYPVMLRAGRQELKYGEERLVGAGNWANTARTFDAVRLSVRGGGVRADLFSASVAGIRDRAFNKHAAGDNLHGAYLSIEKRIPKAKLEPFVFWRVAPRVSAERGRSGKLDTKTAGFDLSGSLPRDWTYAAVMAMQGGRWGGDDVAAWAGHWRAVRAFPQARWRPSLRGEYNFASGDADPSDGRRGTFDTLYPTPHDKYGLADQVGWKNIHHAAFIAEARPRRGWSLQAKYHQYWLAERRDGLYAAGGALVARDPTGASGRRVGQELDVQAIWSAARRWQAGFGLGHLFPGPYLTRVAPGASYTWPYASLRWE
jgi:hypothetical protein